MKKKISCLAVLVAMTALGGAAYANGPALGTVREEPGATLLLPFFEVDLANPAGRTTRFSINNGSPSAHVAHVTIWSDLAVPVLAFDVYLTGYDTQSIDMRDVLNGSLPQTASAGQDPTDTISPKGSLSFDINFASCTSTLPPAPLSPSDAAALRDALTGASSSLVGGDCAGRSSPGRAQGFVTIDVVNNCTSRFPSDSGYFVTGGAGDASNENVLWGDFAYANGTTPIQGAPLVAILADGANPVTSTSGNYTFYGRLVGWDASDNRAPLGTTFVARYVNGSTQAIAWRDPKVNQESFTCGSLPAWYPMGQEGIAMFDQQEHPQVPSTFPVAPQPPFPALAPFPAVAQKTLIGGSSFPVGFVSGWIYYNLNMYVVPAGDNPPADKNAAQAWLMTMRPIIGSTGVVGLVGGPATQLDSASTPHHGYPPS